MLKAENRTGRLRTEDAVDLQPLVRIAGAVAELKFLLHAPNGVAVTAFLHRNNQSLPGIRIDDAAGGQAFYRLKASHGRICLRTEDAVNSHVVTVRPQQQLESLYWVPLVARCE